ncbi:hypothetical protein L210DRAFT_3520835 [Boletus edulis BED1]|uniref:Uncharacterized protein n=1 Tax=Boletus edulis BED1 TaxID=1328754 RepID=A0AAD4GKZ4_BOLED|nr:hypothetical protein L210DRAFT_3520835 [Boletus edulis BED1]
MPQSMVSESHTWSSIRKQEFHAYLYWAFYNSPLPATHLLPDRLRKVLNHAIGQIENRARMVIPDGPNPHLAHGRQT